MTGRDATLLAGGLAVGALVVVAAFGAIPLGKTLFGDTETEIVLRDEGSGCSLTGKETEVQVGKNKKLTWKIKNHCGSQQTVGVGNFRTTAAGSQTTCAAATEGGATSPFQQDDENRRRATAGPGSEEDPDDDAEIQLKVKPRDVLGETQLRYYFDVCLAGNKVDPRLIIER
jgi:hypothetical protein